MCRKFTVFAVGLLLGAGALVAYKKADGRYFNRKPSVEKQIKDQRDRLANLDHEIKRNLNKVAVREVEVKKLEKDIQDTKARQGEAKKRILALREQIKADATLVKSDDAGRKKTEKELTRLFHAYKRCDAELKAKEEKLDAYNEALDAAHDQLSAYQNQRREQDNELARLEAMLARVRAEEIKTNLPLDESKLAAVKREIAQIRERVEVRQKELELEGRYLETAVRSEPAEPNKKAIVDEIDELFGDKK
jgi:chromosome segregation ATPase